MDNNLESVLQKRQSTYGDYATVAALSQALKNTVMQHYFEVHGGNSAKPLPPFMAESISMICHKLSRIANGDPFYADSWQDIAGYAELVVRILEAPPVDNPEQDNENNNNSNKEVK